MEGVGRDVTAEVEARRELERSLSEKQLLLQEVHHRVKNNLAILSSLLELQAATLPDAKLREILLDTQNRILSVARVHEALHSTRESTTHVDLAEYVSRLGGELRDAFGGQGIEVQYELVHYGLSQQRAIHFGLLVNELISNALKHAFPGEAGKRARLQIRLSETNGDLRLDRAGQRHRAAPGLRPAQLAFARRAGGPNADRADGRYSQLPFVARRGNRSPGQDS